ncbi:hypothetical protein HK097_004932, partial [Rhizophlyctis rosea]
MSALPLPPTPDDPLPEDTATIDGAWTAYSPSLQFSSSSNTGTQQSYHNGMMTPQSGSGGMTTGAAGGWDGTGTPPSVQKTAKKYKEGDLVFVPHIANGVSGWMPAMVVPAKEISTLPPDAIPAGAGDIIVRYFDANVFGAVKPEFLQPFKPFDNSFQICTPQFDNRAAIAKAVLYYRKLQVPEGFPWLNWGKSGKYWKGDDKKRNDASVKIIKKVGSVEVRLTRGDKEPEDESLDSPSTSGDGATPQSSAPTATEDASSEGSKRTRRGSKSSLGQSPSRRSTRRRSSVASTTTPTSAGTDVANPDLETSHASDADTGDALPPAPSKRRRSQSQTQPTPLPLPLPLPNFDTPHQDINATLSSFATLSGLPPNSTIDPTFLNALDPSFLASSALDPSYAFNQMMMHPQMYSNLIGFPTMGENSAQGTADFYGNLELMNLKRKAGVLGLVPGTSMGVGGQGGQKMDDRVLDVEFLKRKVEAEGLVRQHIMSHQSFKVAYALRDIVEEKLYAPDKSIYTYAQDKFQISRRAINTYLCATSVLDDLKEDESLPSPQNISHIRCLHKFAAEERRAIWKKVCGVGIAATEELVIKIAARYRQEDGTFEPSED